MILKDILVWGLWAIIGINILYATIDSFMYVVKRSHYKNHGLGREAYEQECNNIKTGAIHHLSWAVLALLILK